jgi:hypothetical protein
VLFDLRTAELTVLDRGFHDVRVNGSHPEGRKEHAAIDIEIGKQRLAPGPPRSPAFRTSNGFRGTVFTVSLSRLASVPELVAQIGHRAVVLPGMLPRPRSREPRDHP